MLRFFLSLFLLTAILDAADIDQGRPVSWRQLAPNIANDQKNIWSLPFHKTEHPKWLPMLAIGGVTAALIAVDSHEARYFRTHTTNFTAVNGAFNGTATESATIGIPIALYGIALTRHDHHAQSTAMLAGEAAVNAELVTIALKDVSRRRGPADVISNDYSGAWGTSKGSYWRGNGSFPSGHTSTAFAVATVISRRYKNQKWLPWVAYSAASMVGFSRLSLSAHYTSDVFLGAALGYSISRFAVLHGE